MTAAPFSSDFLYWNALDFGGSDPADVARFNRFYDETHVPEVFARYPGFVAAHRYALQLPDERGDFGGAYLAAYEIESEQAATAFLAEATADESARPGYTHDPPLWPELLTTRWRVLYEKVAQTSPSTGTPDVIQIIGIDAPAGTGDAELAEFDDFYTHVHLPEATATGGFSRGTRYVLRSALQHPEPGCPRYLAVYELASATDEQVLATRRVMQTSASTPGPTAWARHATPWRLWYRHISFTPRPSPAPATVRQPQ